MPVSSTSAWVLDRQKVSIYEEYQKYIFANGLLTIPAALESVNTLTISLLKTDVKLMGVSRDTLEDVIKSLQIASKIVTKRSHIMWEILVSTE